MPPLESITSSSGRLPPSLLVAAALALGACTSEAPRADESNGEAGGAASPSSGGSASEGPGAAGAGSEAGGAAGNAGDSAGMGGAGGNPGQSTANILPLYPDGMPLDPETVIETDSAVITHWADRARDRHAREPQFGNYDHYLPLYWENRTAELEIVDRVAKGGDSITVNITSLHPLETPDFRAFYRGEGVHTNYWFNVDATELDPLHYTATIDVHPRTNEPLKVGDRMEIEFSQFLRPPVEGRSNYYGSAVLYVVGQGGLSPWEGRGENLDSFPLPGAAWSGGRTTLPYNYSNESVHAFKQLATNIAPRSIQPFMLGRRLHHTDFGNGTHSEANNPIFSAQLGKLGPGYAARSCVGCHVNNGRALPPDVGTTALDIRFFVQDAPWADLTYRIAGESERSLRMEHDEATNGNSTTVRGVPGRAAVEYRFIIGDPEGGSITTPFAEFEAVGGRTGGTPRAGYSAISPALRYAIKLGSDARGTPHTVLGAGLQPESTQGDPEASVVIEDWITQAGALADGTPFELRRPNYAFSGPPVEFFSARIAPPLLGLGLLEAVAETAVAELADPDDADGDGISGRMQVVVDPETGEPRLGRFGWKAGKARLSHQIAAALLFDMGVSTEIFPTLDCGATQAGCGDSAVELERSELEHLVRYIATLGVPARRNLDAGLAQQGEELFASAGCASCHVPTLVTSTEHPYAELRAQTIHAYTDLLLHDMGEELADNMGEAEASGAEWRTPPLWGIGYGSAVSGGEAYLHDGRARNLEEAILWHGGEAAASRNAFVALSAGERQALVSFLQSL